ncbi:50S ribosomal protein L11 methyltransferase [Leptotrichia sp. OH3620_COT-345]|uniref:50S ribosomal protein L11 methyltransferase n=1 Tax=Leptotrichia sp. OH3620_COT-345 TaxID=2491048 RepID=UPI000F6556BD|nr:50S ribosomal protein L11 methyltransferase [Leptotrichia sp. OH3620_COT-345]RRD38969.1 50S ribosomal protein L11 methyltransferase [Leptotrichia sp. OH3620_COT-345]
MKWIKVKTDYFSDNLEIAKAKVMNIFEEIGIKQIEMTDYFSDSSLDYNVNFKNVNDIWSITGYIINNRFSNSKLNIIREKLEEYSESNEEFGYEMYTSECSDNDWKDEWKKYFHTVKITPSIVIKPSWEKYEPERDEKVIEIDPGMAFGTGTHETTALCVEFLEKYSQDRKKFLDIGCGSGILMLIAKRFGIEKVSGIDIDDKVKEVVFENFRRNNICENFEVVIGNLVDNINEKYDIVVSNILVDVLTELLENIENVLEKNSIVIFSGILKEKEEKFLIKTKKHKLKKIDRNEKNNWVSLVFEYKGEKIL